jgi:hypothetical protein
LRCTEWNDENDVDSWCCSKCILCHLPFSNVADDELEFMLSGMTEESHRRYNVCKNMTYQYETKSQLESNHYDFDKDINADEIFYKSTLQSKCSYYSDNDFNTKMQVLNSDRGHLTIMHLHCRSLVAHINDLREYFNGLLVRIGVIALSETWLIPNQHDLSEFNIDGYTMYIMSRSYKHGGGVCIYVREHLQSEQIGIISIFVNIK